MTTIDIDDTTLHHERSGDGPAMLFVHGMCGHADVWADQADRFSRRYSCVRYDRSGHTRSNRGDADCGHVTYAEQPDAFAHAVAVFAAELDRRAPLPSA